MTWDIFCTVIDNYGDIGVTWRLARQLADEHAVPVRLWVDDLRAFQHLRPEIDPALPTQHLAGVEIRHWTTPLADAEPGEVVIEALACNLPEEFVARMAARQPAPIWLNLEYLSAEDWVASVHGLPSPHPRLPLTKYFFMPGYTENTGGLMRESWLTARRDAFRADESNVGRKSGSAFRRPPQACGFNVNGRHDIGGGRRFAFPPYELPLQADELLVSLFSYENQALPSLLQAWASGGDAVRVFVPVGKALPEIAAWFGETVPAPGVIWQRGALTLHVLPMLDQDAYDRLLWACDLNFVRGEDSFVRAQFAARPLVWQAYVQDDNAHFAKLDAFLALYCAGMDAQLAARTRTLWRAWNHEAEIETGIEAEIETDMSALWPQLRDALPALTAHARAWDTRLAAQADLATNLLNFCRKWLK
ncbi:MAG: elongation factor P maturation arginine rhamnosyltransferase EarP [Pseudomonadota bacterium]|nr:elongation factor P maturation arginine rhamnosyltransferase EarP [Pseudomonadota bacterium]